MFTVIVKQSPHHHRCSVSFFLMNFHCSYDLLNSFSANYDQFRSSNDFNASAPSLPLAPKSSIAVDPFQTVDPFASQSDIGSPTTLTNNDWYQQTNNGANNNDPFLSNNEVSPKYKKSAPKKAPNIDPWGGSSATNNGNGWAQFNSTANSNGNSLTNSSTVQYRALYDYRPERPDEMEMVTGDMITVSAFELVLNLIRKRNEF